MTSEVTDKIYKWQDLGRGRFSEPFHPNMLLPNGYVQYGRYMLKGSPEAREDREAIYVRFDRDYTIQKIEKLVEPLIPIAGFSEVRTFFDDLRNYTLKKKFGVNESSDYYGDK